MEQLDSAHGVGNGMVKIQTFDLTTKQMLKPVVLTIKHREIDIDNRQSIINK